MQNDGRRLSAIIRVLQVNDEDGWFGSTHDHVHSYHNSGKSQYANYDDVDGCRLATAMLAQAERKDQYAEGKAE